MRCYLIRNGHIAGVETLEGTTSDEDAVARATAIFERLDRGRFDGFEVWDQKRFLYRWPTGEQSGFNQGT